MNNSPAGALVGLVMGSDSDWPVMEAAARRGLRAIIAGAGGAAHLPGMLASLTSLPVIGVPVPLKHLDGMDSLLSIVQMPAGIPVATVSVGGARNAGLLAVRILASGEGQHAQELSGNLKRFAQELRQTALDKGAKLRKHAGMRIADSEGGA